MDLRNINLSLNDVAGSERVLLTEITALTEFKEGKRTEKQIGFKYSVVCPDSNPRYQPLTVKILKTKPVVSKEELDQANLAKDDIYITFTNFRATLYLDRNSRPQISASADSAELLLV